MKVKIKVTLIEDDRECIVYNDAILEEDKPRYDDGTSFDEMVAAVNFSKEKLGEEFNSQNNIVAFFEKVIGYV